MTPPLSGHHGGELPPTEDWREAFDEMCGLANNFFGQLRLEQGLGARKLSSSNVSKLNLIQLKEMLDQCGHLHHLSPLRALLKKYSI